MKTFTRTLIAGTVACGALASTMMPASAEHGRNGAAAAGAIGGLAVGAAIGAAASQPRYTGAARYEYEDQPAYVCHHERRRVYGDDGRIYIRKVRVCE